MVSSRWLLWVGLSLAGFLTACGYSEDEWQAQLAKYNELQARCGGSAAPAPAQAAPVAGAPPAQPSPPPAGTCSADKDCAGNMVCEQGRCQAPR